MSKRDEFHEMPNYSTKIYFLIFLLVLTPIKVSQLVVWNLDQRSLYKKMENSRVVMVNLTGNSGGVNFEKIDILNRGGNIFFLKKPIWV